jgi:hypothetical protein
MLTTIKTNRFEPTCGWARTYIKVTLRGFA